MLQQKILLVEKTYTLPQKIAGDNRRKLSPAIFYSGRMFFQSVLFLLHVFFLCSDFKINKKNYKNTILHLTDFRIRYILLFAVADESDSKIQFFDRIGKERIEQVRFYERRRQFLFCNIDYNVFQVLGLKPKSINSAEKEGWVELIYGKSLPFGVLK